MSPESNKKSPRTFQCRQSLWHKFEQMARELECSVDYLINDAMKQYARQRGYSQSAKSADGAETGGSQAPVAAALPVALPPPAPTPMRSGASSVSRQMGGSGAHSGSGLLSHSSLSPAPNLGVVPPPPVARSPLSMPAPPGARVPVPPPPAGRSLPPPPPGAAGRPAATGARPSMTAPPPKRGAAPGGTRQAAFAATAPRLAIRYRGQVFSVNKDRFIIGRGKQSSDLTIKDPNVSRQHALIEFSNGQYFIVDMGSTNGIEFEGQRVQRKNIHDRDRFRVCDHELEFLYQ